MKTTCARKGACARKGKRICVSILILSIFLLSIPQARSEPRHSQRSKGESPRRIVSLAPACTETLIELGLKDRLVGITPFSDYLKEAKDIEKIGFFTQPSLEKIVALRPDLVLAADYIGQESICRTLKRLGIKVEVFRRGGVKNMLEMVAEVGGLCDKERESRKLIGAMKATMHEAKRKVEGMEKPRVYVEVGYSPLFTAGKGSHIDDLIEIAGGENIAREIDKPYPRISQEFIIQKDPQVIILPYMGRGYTKESVKKRSGWENISAVQNNRIYDDIGTQIITIPSPNLILKGLPELAKRIHPGVEDF